MNVHARLAATGLVLTLLGAACSPEADRKAEPAAAPAVAASPDVHSFRIGTMEAFALKDGVIALPNAAGQSPWSDTEAAAAVLTAAGQPTGVIPLSIQPLLIRAGDRVVLIDTGARGQMGTENRLMASLRAAGVEPGQVTDILISHTHDDHVGGLVDANGALAFPNAAIRMSAAGWADFQPQDARADLVRAITPRVQTFEAGVTVVPGIRALTLAGHTPGHTGYEIGSGADRAAAVEAFTRANAQPLENGIERDVILARDSRAKAQVFAPTEIGGVWLPREALGHISAPGFSGNRSAVGISMGGVNHARASRQAVVNVFYVVDFANAETYGGWFRNSSAVSVQAGLAIVPELSKVFVYAPNGRVVNVSPREPIAVGGDFGTFGDTTTNGERVAEIATNIIGALGGIGTNSTRRYAMQADAPRWEAGVGELTTAASARAIEGLRTGR